MVLLWLLGTGAAEGIPVHGCHCTACMEARRNPLYRRRQATYLVDTGNLVMLLDCGSQEVVHRELLDVEIDYVFISHPHLDHVTGIHDLRWSKQSKQPTLVINRRFMYCDEMTYLIPRLRIFSVEYYEEGSVYRLCDGTRITPIRLRHGDLPTYGFLIDCGKVIAYLLDTKGLPQESLKLLREYSIDVALVDSTFGSGYVSDAHNTVVDALEFSRMLNVRKLVLTHISHNVTGGMREIEELARRYVKELSVNCEILIALDGMEIHL